MPQDDINISILSKLTPGDVKITKNFSTSFKTPSFSTVSGQYSWLISYIIAFYGVNMTILSIYTNFKIKHNNLS